MYVMYVCVCVVFKSVVYVLYCAVWDSFASKVLFRVVDDDCDVYVCVCLVVMCADR